MISRGTGFKNNPDPNHPSSTPNRPISYDESAPSYPSSAAEPTPSTDASPSANKTPKIIPRGDIWTEDATETLIDAWGCRFLGLNSGGLGREHWQQVSDAVNAVRGTSQKQRTVVQCRKRIDNVKRRYRMERSKIVQSGGRSASTWPHFQRLHSLIGDSFVTGNNSNADGHTTNSHRSFDVPAEAAAAMKAKENEDDGDDYWTRLPPSEDWKTERPFTGFAYKKWSDAIFQALE